ncbi:MerR family transcriptional regulator [Actinokineospora bangkokensis]|uniref:HTH merR-type domain-containing protein n=1 Tax=Actinokineospora bangkokensis TaxID=1193682 RepID=A0A1Q9LEN4_9PSEU|nr:MerR family transcriptional regulator [Actinokineospora bangkokensis]OLR90475.1 hypothetical protein BJP25_27955 [Actinokineospora bangkokensis]
MRIAELSRRTGVAVPTIKFYLREGVLAPGERTSPNQASYGDAHVHRLRLVRALVEVGGLPLAAVRDVLDTVDSAERGVDKTLGTVQNAVITHAAKPAADDDTPDPARTAAEEAVAELIDDMGWQVGTDHPSARALVSVLVAAEGLGHGRIAGLLAPYAEACTRIAAVDLDYVAAAGALDDMVESVVVGTVLGDSILTALRRLAHVHESGSRYHRRPG